MHIKPRCQWGLSGIGMKYSPHPVLRFRRPAGRDARLADLYSTVGIALLRNCYCQIFGPRCRLAKFANGLWKMWTSASASTRISSWAATEGYLERSDAFGFVANSTSCILAARLMIAADAV